jgi:hypothetical protein
MKRSLSFIAALAAALTLGVGQAPAQADVRLEKYYAVSQYGDSLEGWFWIDEIDGIIGCPRCGHLIDLGKSRQLDPSLEKTFQHNLMAGLNLMSNAHATADPVAANKLRQEALNAFTVSARVLGTASVRPGVVGYYDPDKRLVVRTNDAWLAAADQDLADGIMLLKRALVEPVPVPWRERALAEFTEAFNEIAKKRAIGS